MARTKKIVTSFTLGIFLLLYTLINMNWISNYRDGGLFDIDESAYLMMAVKNYFAYVNGGFLSWLLMVESPNAASPLTSALASLLFVATGPRLAFGIYVPLFACIVSIVCIYYIAKHCGDRSFAAVTALLVATTPLLVIYSRSFHFAMPATACTTAALLCLIKSEQAARWAWIVAFGFFVGLMPLARTMTIAFIPCIGIAAFIYVAGSSVDKLPRIGRLFVAGIVACATSATWLAWNGSYVAEYLFSFGYGARAQEFGPKLSYFGSIRYMVQVYLDQVYAPHFIAISLGMAMALLVLAKNVLRGPPGQLWNYVASPITPLSIFVLSSFLVLCSSQNKGTAFIAPILPATILLSTWSLFKLANNSHVCRGALAASLTLIATYSFVPMVALNPVVSTRTTHWLPGYGNVVYSDGSGTQQVYEAAHGLNMTSPGKALPQETAAAWKSLYVDTLDAVMPLAGSTRTVAFGFRNAVYNVNTIGLTNSLRNQEPLYFAQIEPLVTGESTEGYLAWLSSGPAKKACVLLTSPGADAEFSPYVNTALLEIAAKQANFVVMDSLTMPNGRIAKIWARPCDR
ncbi:ArnT family glycosyltransferase [Agrobacterium tumefaciens]|uniref:ArnT family glycosyltransferase n=1 Tax=Agrobacterium tumefaciens TaxID=358 RepID=UPI001ADC4105|nr:glycosyltransferase family 39 protein [Agrobacterium tumefaciens]